MLHYNDGDGSTEPFESKLSVHPVSQSEAWRSSCTCTTARRDVGTFGSKRTRPSTNVHLIHTAADASESDRIDTRSADRVVGYRWARRVARAGGRNANPRVPAGSEVNLGTAGSALPHRGSCTCTTVDRLRMRRLVPSEMKGLEGRLCGSIQFVGSVIHCHARVCDRGFRNRGFAFSGSTASKARRYSHH